MAHPFTRQPRALLIYSLAWLITAIFVFIVLRLSLGFSMTISITEGLLTSLLFGLLGLIAWYPTTYIPVMKEAPVSSITAHIVAGLIIVTVWLIVTLGVLKALFAGQSDYIRYLNKSMFIRGMVGGMAYLVLVLIYYLVSYVRKLREKVQAEEKLRTLVRESELNLLKSQINPHFLFNSLNSISSLIMSDPEKAREMIVLLSELLRYSLKNRQNEFVPLDEELGRMQDYLSIEKIRFGEKLQFDIKAPGECRKIKVPTLILQPLVENAIKHGVYESIEPVGIRFTCRMTENSLLLELKNDFDPTLPSRRGTGVGLQNVSERIRLAYEGRGFLTRTAEGGVFTVVLTIPVEKAES